MPVSDPIICDENGENNKIKQSTSVFILHQNWHVEDNNRNNLWEDAKMKKSDEFWTHFCRTTTIHGFFRTVDPFQPSWMRFFWSIIVISLSFILLLNTGMVSRDILGNRNVLSSLTVVNNRSLTFPDIHICDLSFFSRQRLSEMGFNETMGNYLIAAQSTLLLADSFQRDHERIRQFDIELDRLLKPFGGDLRVVSLRAALKCDEIIAGCIKHNKRFNGSTCCQKFFDGEKRLNAFGSCVTTAGSEQHVEIMAINLRGFTVLVKMNPDRITLDPNIIAPALTERKGIYFSVSHPNVYSYASLLADAKFVEPGSAAMIALSVTKTDNSAMKNSPLAPRDCAFANEERYAHLAQGFHRYSLANCELSVDQQAILKVFNCTILSLPKIHDNVSHCLPKDYARDIGFAKFHSTVKQMENNCMQDCISIEYSTQMSSGRLTLNPESVIAYAIDPCTDMNQMASLHFFFPSLSYTVIVNQPESLLKWLSDVGGIMGLYMGASLISVLEILIFLFRCLLRFRRSASGGK